MPQRGLETLFYGGAGDPDLPAESFRVRIEQWADHIPVYHREDSTKGNTNPKSNSHRSRPSSNSSSRRFSTNLKATTKLHHSHYAGHSTRRQAQRRSEQPRSRKPPELAFEPTSPKVSCFGKVLPETQMDRCRIPRQRSPETSVEDVELVGCWGAFIALFRCNGGGRRAAEDSSSSSAWNIPSSMEEDILAMGNGWEAVAPPGVGEMKRFASGRRAAWWEEVEEDREAGCSERGRVWARRSVGSLEDAERDRGWESVGSASV